MTQSPLRRTSSPAVVHEATPSTAASGRCCPHATQTSPLHADGVVRAAPPALHGADVVPTLNPAPPSGEGLHADAGGNPLKALNGDGVAVIPTQDPNADGAAVRRTAQPDLNGPAVVVKKVVPPLQNAPADGAVIAPGLPPEGNGGEDAVKRKARNVQKDVAVALKSLPLQSGEDGDGRRRVRAPEEEVEEEVVGLNAAADVAKKAAPEALNGDGVAVILTQDPNADDAAVRRTAQPGLNGHAVVAKKVVPPLQNAPADGAVIAPGLPPEENGEEDAVKRKARNAQRGGDGGVRRRLQARLRGRRLPLMCLPRPRTTNTARACRHLGSWVGVWPRAALGGQAAGGGGERPSLVVVVAADADDAASQVPPPPDGGDVTASPPPLPQHQTHTDQQPHP